MHSSTPTAHGVAAVGLGSPVAIELVKKIGTSATTPFLERLKKGRKKLRTVTKEHRRIAKAKGLRAVAVTLTYADSKDFKAKHVSKFLSALRAKLKRLGYPLLYLWTLEAAGTIHYHLTVWLPRGFKLAPSTLAKSWPWGSTWVNACRSIKAWVAYICKDDDKRALPRGARLYGHGGLDADGKVSVLRASLPRWLLKLLPKDAIARRAPGGGWADALTGEIFRSPYMWTPWGIVPRTPSTLLARGLGADPADLKRAAALHAFQMLHSPMHRVQH